MKDFLDILREQVEHPSATREQELYISRLRALASHPKAERRSLAGQNPKAIFQSRLLP